MTCEQLQQLATDELIERTPKLGAKLLDESPASESDALMIASTSSRCWSRFG